MTIEFMLLLGLVLMGAFAVQYILGFKQIKHFGEEYKIMRREGKVAIGRHAGRIQAGTIILFSLDENSRIKRGRKLQGTSILARFRDFNQFNGRKIDEITINDAEIKKELKITRKAIMNAVDNYNAFVNGVEIPEKKSPFGQITEKLKRR